MTATVETKKAAIKIVNKGYELDRSGGLFRHSNSFGFNGSVLNISCRKTEGGYEVTVQSSYYAESTLREFFR